MEQLHRLCNLFSRSKARPTLIEVNERLVAAATIEVTRHHPVSSSSSCRSTGNAQTDNDGGDYSWTFLESRSRSAASAVSALKSRSFRSLYQMRKKLVSTSGSFIMTNFWFKNKMMMHFTNFKTPYLKVTLYKTSNTVSYERDSLCFLSSKKGQSFSCCLQVQTVYILTFYQK